jgi:precorrin-4/cobalt-precorrin-4 C11-methyltransferase
MRRLKALGIPHESVPGVAAFTAAAAVLGRELTLPELCQTVILSRAEGRTPMPESEALADLARHRATLVSQHYPPQGGDGRFDSRLRGRLPGGRGPQGTCPDQKIVTGALANIRAK